MRKLLVLALALALSACSPTAEQQWRTCVEQAEGGDASYQRCDELYGYFTY